MAGGASATNLISRVPRPLAIAGFWQSFRQRPLVIASVIAPAVGLGALAFEAGGYYPGATADAGLVALGLLAAWALLSRAALQGFGRSALIVVAFFAGFAVWTLLSGTWSHSPGRALIEFDRTLLYVAVLTVFVFVGSTKRRVRALVACLAGASAVVSVVGLGAWLLPDVVHVSSSFVRRRMSYPTGYWNATGLLAGFGIVWSLHLASASREHLLLRLAGAAAIVPCVAVLGFSASRGAALATVLGVIVYVLLTHSRGVVIGLLACLPAATAASLVVAQTSQLSTNLLSPEAISKGHTAAVTLAICAGGVAALRGLLSLLDHRVARIKIAVPSIRLSTRHAVAAVALVVAVAVAAGAAADLPAHARQAYHDFVSGPADGDPGNAHFTSLSSDGRTELWHVALKYGLNPNPLLGSGAGTYAILWERYRNAPSDAPVASSLFVGTLGDLGLVGALLLVAGLAGIVVALARRVRRTVSDRPAWAALLAATVGWLVFAVFDWDWQLPACTIWLFAAGGMALSRAGEGTVVDSLRPSRARLWAKRMTGGALAAVSVALGLIPLSLARSESALDHAIIGLQRDNCNSARADATRARDAVSQRAEPYMVLAYCAARQDRSKASLEDAAGAVQRDPDNWEVYYTQALAQAAAGERPRTALREMLLRNPLGSYAIEAHARLVRGSSSARRGAALRLPLPLAMDGCGGPTQADQVAPCGNPELPMLDGPLIQTQRP